MSTADIPILLPLLLTSAYALHHVYNSITLFRLYESQSEKAAEWSSTAADRLRKTRTTQAGCAGAITVSLLSTLLLLLITSPPLPTPLIYILNTGLPLLSSTHMSTFYNPSNSPRMPFVEKYNDAVRRSQVLIGILRYLGIVWGIAAGMWVLGAGAWGKVVVAVLVGGYGGLWVRGSRV